MTTTRRQALIATASLAIGAVLPFRAGAFVFPPEVLQDKYPADPSFDAAVSLSDLEAIAHRRLDAMSEAYIDGAAGDEITLRWNREAYDKIKILPRVLHDVSVVDTRTTVLGIPLDFPILLGPTALHKLAHPDGELATARAAASAHALMGLSTMSSTTLEDVAAASNSPKWFQLYVQKDKGFTAELVQRAVKSGYKALVVTVDTPTEGARNRQQRAGFHLPPGVDLANLRGLKTASGRAPGTEREVFENILPDKLTWKEIEWLQSLSSLPVLLKGILNPEDAALAVKQGVAGVIVSNHGARNLDTVPATIEALPRITDRVAGRITVLVDGGVRRGTDVLKALARGANAVLVGRPIFYGLSAAGEAGVVKMLGILRKEFEMAMALSGRTRISEIVPEVIWKE